MEAFKLIVGKSANADIYGASTKGEIYGTVVPNYVGGELITEFIATAAGNVTFSLGGKKLTDNAIITFASGIQVTLDWDPATMTYELGTPSTTVYDYLKNRDYDVAEFAIVGLTLTSGDNGTDPSDGGDDNDDDDGDNCDNTPNRHWSKPELIAYANEHGIDITGLTRKADILAAILGA